MSCQDTQSLMHGYLDGELDLVSNLGIEQHLEDCQACTQAYQNHRALSSAIDKGSLYFSAPAGLQKRVRTAVRRESKSESRPGISSWRWIGVGASLAMITVVIWAVVFTRIRSAGDDLLTQEIVSGHVRSLMATHLTDVPSSDRHTVKPWFGGKLDFSPPVPDLSGQGFSLVGGRLDYIGNRVVAAVVYQRRQHLINLFVWQSIGSSDGYNQTTVQQGYSLIHWTKLGLVYWAASDLNKDELQEFAEAIRSST